MSTLLDQLADALMTALAPVSAVNGRVFEDRTRAYTRDEAPAIELKLDEDASDTMGDDHPARSILHTKLSFDVCIYARADTLPDGSEPTARSLTNPIWQDAHQRILTDVPAVLPVRIRWRGCTWRRDQADGAIVWADHRYEATLAIRELTLTAPL